MSFNGHHGKIFNFNSIYHHGAQASAPIETTTTTTTTTEAPQTPKSTGGHHGFKKHFNINWSYNFNHGPSAANANANVNSNANAVVEAVTALVATTETPFEEEIKIEDFGTNFDTKVDDDSIVEDFHVQDEVVSGNTDHESVNGTDTETGLISNEYLPPKY